MTALSNLRRKDSPQIRINGRRPPVYAWPTIASHTQLMQEDEGNGELSSLSELSCGLYCGQMWMNGWRMLLKLCFAWIDSLLLFFGCRLHQHIPLPSVFSLRGCQLGITNFRPREPSENAPRGAPGCHWVHWHQSPGLYRYSSDGHCPVGVHVILLCS